MNRKDIKLKLREQKKLLRLSSKERRKQIKERLDQLRPVKSKKPKSKKAIFVKLILLLILILFLLRDSCSEMGGKIERPNNVDIPKKNHVAGVKKSSVKKHTLSKRSTGRFNSRKRSDFILSSPKPQPWITGFRMQVAARSGRLARCFEGADRPGAIKWSGAVEPTEGTVSDHTIEPILYGGEIPNSKLNCLKNVLTYPPYILTGESNFATPSRVGMVIEF